MPRFFIDQPLLADTHLALPEPVARHIQVLRLAPGDTLTLFNGEGSAFSATLESLDKRQAMVRVSDRLPDDGTAPPYRIALVQGIPSNEKMDWLIEKAVELGVHRIVPVTAERSVVRLSGERIQRRLAHWEALIRAACEQCGRNAPPEVVMPTSFDQWLANQPRDPAPDTLRLLLSPRGSIPFHALPATPPTGGTTILIGPEGGWSAREEDDAKAAGFQALSLGPRVLRTETAAMALLAAFAARWGGWGA